MAPEDRLESWKEIAAYLKRDVRTVQRWEADESLPVHRHQHKKRGSVYAHRHELDDWRASRTEDFFVEPVSSTPHTPSPSPFTRTWSVTALAIALGALTLSLTTTNSSDPSVTPALDPPRLLDALSREGSSITRVPLSAAAYELELSRDGRLVYAAVCRDDGTSGLDAIDTASLTRLWSVEQIGSCSAIALSASGDRLFTSDRSDLVVMNTQTRSLRRISTPAAELRSLVVAADDRHVYAAAVFKGVLEIDTQDGSVTTTSPMPCPVALAASRDRGRLYASYQCSGPGGRPGHDAIEVFDTSSGRSLRAINGLPNVGSYLAVSPDDSQLWADGGDACRSAYYDHAGCPPGAGAIVNVIRTGDHSLMRSLRLGADGEFNTRLSFTPDGSRITGGHQEAMVISTSSLAVVESTARPYSSNVVFSPDRSVAYAVIGDERSLAVIPVATHLAPPPGLSGRWTVDGVGTDSGGGNDIPRDPAPVFVPGHTGQALAIGSGPAIRISSPSNFDIHRGHMTAMAWVKPDRPGTVLEYVSRHAAGDMGWRLFIDDRSRPAICIGSLADNRCAGTGSRTLTADAEVPRHAWSHLAAVRSGDSVTLFVNGRSAGAAAELRPTTGLQSILWFRIGSDEAGLAPFEGKIDEIELYNRALLPAEIVERGK
jgi:DNA-binding beta-propeller fold protein YncE